MEEQNLPCLVLQYNKNNKIMGIEVTSTYNYWEKLAFVEMNEKQLFPYKIGNIKYNRFSEWLIYIEMLPIIGNVYKTAKDITSTVSYPGY